MRANLMNLNCQILVNRSDIKNKKEKKKKKSTSLSKRSVRKVWASVVSEATSPQIFSAGWVLQIVDRLVCDNSDRNRMCTFLWGTHGTPNGVIVSCRRSVNDSSDRNTVYLCPPLVFLQEH